MQHFVTVKGQRFELIHHQARGASGMAWSAYRDGGMGPFAMLQTRTMRELKQRLVYLVEGRAAIAAQGGSHAYAYAGDPDDETGYCQLCGLDAAAHKGD